MSFETDSQGSASFQVMPNYDLGIRYDPGAGSVANSVELNFENDAGSINVPATWIAASSVFKDSGTPFLSTDGLGNPTLNNIVCITSLASCLATAVSTSPPGLVGTAANTGIFYWNQQVHEGTGTGPVNAPGGTSGVSAHFHQLTWTDQNWNINADKFRYTSQDASLGTNLVVPGPVNSGDIVGAMWRIESSSGWSYYPVTYIVNASDGATAQSVALGICNNTQGNTYTTTGASGTGTTATITFSSSITLTVGNTILISGMTPSGYNGVQTITGASAGSVSFASTATGAQTAGGTLTSIGVTTGTSGTGAAATVTFTGGVIIPPGATVVISGVTPTGYNGVQTVTASSAGSITFTSTAVGDMTVAGTVVSPYNNTLLTALLGYQDAYNIGYRPVEGACSGVGAQVEPSPGGGYEFTFDAPYNPASVTSVKATATSPGTFQTYSTFSSGQGYHAGQVVYFAPIPETVTGASGTGSTATITFSGSTALSVGQSVAVAGVAPAGYNGTYTVTTSSISSGTVSVSYANTTTGSYTGGGTITGLLPSGLAQYTPYYVISTGLMDNQFEISAAQNSTVAVTLGGLATNITVEANIVSPISTSTTNVEIADLSNTIGAKPSLDWNPIFAQIRRVPGRSFQNGDILGIYQTEWAGTSDFFSSAIVTTANDNNGSTRIDFDTATNGSPTNPLRLAQGIDAIGTNGAPCGTDAPAVFVACSITISNAPPSADSTAQVPTTKWTQDHFVPTAFTPATTSNVTGGTGIGVTSTGLYTYIGNTLTLTATIIVTYASTPTEVTFTLPLSKSTAADNNQVCSGWNTNTGLIVGVAVPSQTNV